MNRFLFLSLGILFSTLFVGLSAPYSVSAQSEFDDAYQGLNSLVLHYNSSTSEGYSSIDVSTQLNNVFSNNLYDDDQQIEVTLQAGVQNYIDQWNNEKNNWFISQRDTPTNPSVRETYFCFTTGSDFISLGWEPDAVFTDTPYALSYKCFYIIPGFNDNTLVVGYANRNIGNMSIISTGPNYWNSSNETYVNFIANVDYYNYPAGYQGPTIPDTHIPVEPETPPEFQFTYSVADKDITLYDLSDLSLDQSDCYFQINPNGTQVNTELHFDCDTKNSVTHTVDEYGLYDVTLMYVTPNGLKSSIILTLDIDGSSFSDTYGYAVNQVFYQCIYSELPFINFTECYNNVLIFTNMLFFDRLQFGTDFTPPDGCRTLVVLGDWIGAPTNTVCPMIPSFIRDVTTPFVTFLLGLLMLKFITSRAGGGFS